MSTGSAKTFRERCTEAARDFVRTVVVVDDHPVPRTEEKKSATPPAMMRRPKVTGHEENSQAENSSPELATAAATDEGGSEVAPVLVAQFSEDPSHALAGDVLQRAFADEEVLCSVFFENKPTAEEEENFLTRVQRVAARSDVLILDWSWNGDGGVFCQRVIQSLCTGKEAMHRKLVLVYTADTDPDGILEKLANIPEQGVFQGRVSEDERRFCFCWPSSGVSVQVLQKSGSGGAQDFYLRSRVRERELPARVFEIFGEHFGGVLANAAMRGLGRIRDQTHRILDRFRSDFDTAYVVHRAYTLPRTSAEEQVRDLFADTLGDTLDGEGMLAFVGDESVRSWMEERLEKEGVRSRFEKAVGISTGNVDAMVLGVDSVSGISNRTKKRAGMIEVAESLNAVAGAPSHIDEFSLFMYSEVDRRGGSSVLSNGAIICREGTDECMLCVMPLCDAERVPNDLHFPFLVMHPGRGVAEGVKNVLVRRNDSISEFHVVATMQNVRTVLFGGTGTNGPVRAKDGVILAASGDQYNYVGRLRSHVASDIAQSLGASGTRIGTMVSEFTRRS